MFDLHLICRGHLNVRTIKFPVFESGDWDVSASDADKLVGGTLYLHETKTQPSYFGGTVESWRHCRQGEADTNRIVFTVKSTAKGKGAAWEGQAHGMAWSGGLVSVEIQHSEGTT